MPRILKIIAKGMLTLYTLDIFIFESPSFHPTEYFVFKWHIEYKCTMEYESYCQVSVCPYWSLSPLVALRACILIVTGVNMSRNFGEIAIENHAHFHEIEYHHSYKPYSFSFSDIKEVFCE